MNKAKSITLYHIETRVLILKSCFNKHKPKRCFTSFAKLYEDNVPITYVDDTEMGIHDKSYHPLESLGDYE